MIKEAEIQQGNIVKTQIIGNVTVHICSDFFPKTPEEKERVLAEYHAAGWRIWNRLNEEREISSTAKVDS